MRLISFTIFFLLNQITAQLDKHNSNVDLEALYPDSNLFISHRADWQISAYKKRINDFKENPIGYKKIVFLGNSITEGGRDWNKKFGLNNVINRGITGDITGGVLARLDEIHYYKPTAVFLLIGLNDIFNGDIPYQEGLTTSYVAENILRIAKEIQRHSESTEIFIQTILPIDKKKFMEVRGFYPQHSVPLMSQINEINLKIYKKNKNNAFTVIDLHSAFVNERGLMNEVYSTDGVHLNEAGYQVWVEYVGKYVRSFANSD